MPKRALLLYAILVLGLAAAAALVLYFTWRVRVTTVRATHEPAVQAVYATGAVEPVHWAKVAPIVTARVVEIAVRDANLSIAAGEFVAITGPSGSGKSSLLYLLGLLDAPTEGSISIEGRETNALDDEEFAEIRLRKLGFVFQFHFLLPEFTVLGNILLPMRRLAVISERAMRARANELLARMGLAAHGRRRPDQLSGGERQRVAVARALANDPRLILADEPTGNLDTKNARIVFDLLGELAHDEGRAVVAVTHDPELAVRTDRQLRIVDGRLDT